MKIAEIRSKTETEIVQEVIKLRKELMNLRFQKVNGQLQNTAVVSGMKKDIAKFKTILTEKKKNIVHRVSGKTVGNDKQVEKVVNKKTSKGVK